MNRFGHFVRILPEASVSIKAIMERHDSTENPSNFSSGEIGEISCIVFNW